MDRSVQNNDHGTLPSLHIQVWSSHLSPGFSDNKNSGKGSVLSTTMQSSTSGDLVGCCQDQTNSSALLLLTSKHHVYQMHVQRNYHSTDSHAIHCQQLCTLSPPSASSISPALSFVSQGHSLLVLSLPACHVYDRMTGVLLASIPYPPSQDAMNTTESNWVLVIKSIVWPIRHPHGIWHLDLGSTQFVHVRSNASKSSAAQR